MSISNLSDTALLASLTELARQGRQWEVVVLRHLAEVDRRDGLIPPREQRDLWES